MTAAKIAIPSNSAHSILHPLASVLKTVESESLQIVFWNTQEKSIFDLFDEFSPSHLFITEGELSEELNMLSNEFNFKYALITSQNDISFPIQQSPHLIINTSGADGVGATNHMPWQPASNVAQIHNGSYKKNKQSDILVLTGSVPMSDKMLDMIDCMSKTYSVKIVGSAMVNLPYYLGAISIFEKADFIKSAKLLLDFGSYDCLDAAYLKTPSLVYSQHTPVFKYFTNLTQLKDLASEIIQQNDERAENYADGLYGYVTGGHTSYHRCGTIFDMLGEPEIKEAVLGKLGELMQ